MHEFSKGIVGCDTGVGIASIAERARIAERMRRAYQAATAANPGNDDSLWQQIEPAFHGQFFHCLTAETESELIAYLENLFEEGVLHGLDQSGDQTEILRTVENERVYVAMIKDRLVSLAEALGCIPIENPEQGRWGENVYLDADELIDKIESIMGIDITPPEVASGRIGLKTKRGVLAYGEINALYTAWRIKQLLIGLPAPRICEIGAGLGRVAYYCHRLDIRNYTIIDLPQINAVQTAYLLTALPEAVVCLQGDAEEDADLHILPFWRFQELPDSSFDLVLNQNSFPEMGYTAIIGYLNLIKRKSVQLLHMNHEGEPIMTPGGHKQHVVGSLIRQIGGYRQIYRFPYWLRRGYVEELYIVQ